MNQPAAAAADPANNPGDPPPVVELSPVFAGADPIEEENQGNVEDLHEGITPQSDLPPPPTDPEPPAPEPEAQQASEDGGEAPTEAPSAQEDTAPVSEPVADTQQQEQAAAEPEQPQNTDSRVEVPAQQNNADVESEASHVPSFRLAQEAARRRAAEARAQEMEAQLRRMQQQPTQQAPAQPPQNQAQQQAPQQEAPPVQASLDLGDNPKQMFDKVLDGDLDKATELFQDMMKQAVAANQQAPVQQQLDPQQLDQMVAQRVQAMQYQEAEMGVIAKLEQQYNELNPEHDAFQKDLVDEILALKGAYVQQHYTPADALERAAMAVMQLNGISQPASSAPVASAPQAVPPEQTKAAVQRNINAQNQQPPEMPQGASPQAPPEIDIMKLSEEEFAALPEATLARLRGDFG